MVKDLKRNGFYDARDVNTVIISGRVHYEPNAADFTYSENNGARFNFKIKTNGVAQTPQIFRVILWGARAEEYYALCHKDDYVLIQGELRKNNWVDDKGVIHDDAEIIASKLELIGG